MKLLKNNLRLLAVLLIITMVSGSAFSVMADEPATVTAEENETVQLSDEADPELAVPEETEQEENSEEGISRDDTDLTDESVDEKDDIDQTDPIQEEASDESASDDTLPSETEVSSVDNQEEDLADTPDDTSLADPDENADTDTAAAEGDEAEETGDSANETTGNFTFTLNTETNKYTVRIGSFKTQEAFTGIKVKVWSKVKGDDDAKWLTLKSSVSGSTYWASSYINDFKNYGSAYAEFYLVKEDETIELIDTQTLAIAAPTIGGSEVKVNEKMSSISINLTDFKSELAIDQVKACVWRKSDKSDLVWYELENTDTSYSIQNIYAKDFGGYSGKYKVRVLAYPVKGNPKELVNTTAEIPESGGYCSYSDNYPRNGSREKSFRLRIRGLARTKGISSVEFEFWHDGDYAKRKTYKGTFENGFYYCDVKIKDFKQAGQYKMNVFVTDKSGTKVRVKSKKILTVTGEAGGTITQKKVKEEKGTFVLSMKGFSSPSGVKSVRFGVWSKKNKSNKYFYTAVKQTDGSYQAVVNVKNHKYIDGTFYVRPIVEMGNSVTDIQETVTFEFSAKNLPFVIDKGNGRRTIGILGPSPAKNIKFAVWGSKNDQNDLKWYTGNQSGNRWTAEVVCYDHKETGTYNLHAYSGNTVLGTTTFKVVSSDLKKNGYFYENGLKFYYIDGVLQKNYRAKVKGPYQICVNRTHCTITIYAKDGDNGFIQPISYFPCSVGVDWAPTPTGIFHLSSKLRWKHFYTWDTYVQYAVRYSEGRFFHSVTCTAPSVYALDAASYNKLGSPASHGCIRLTVIDAKWIYGNLNQIAEVKIYDSADPGPFGKAPSIKIPPTQNWDPTDPAITG